MYFILSTKKNQFKFTRYSCKFNKFIKFYESMKKTTAKVCKTHKNKCKTGKILTWMYQS